MKLKLSGAIRLEGSNGFSLGKGKALLLQKINECGSIAAAARSMELSYRRAWAMVRQMNASSGILLVEKNPGGAHGGGARLTTQGKELLTSFLQLDNEFEKFKNRFKPC